MLVCGLLFVSPSSAQVTCAGASAPQAQTHDQSQVSAATPFQQNQQRAGQALVNQEDQGEEKKSNVQLTSGSDLMLLWAFAITELIAVAWVTHYAAHA